MDFSPLAVRILPPALAYFGFQQLQFILKPLPLPDTMAMDLLSIVHLANIHPLFDREISSPVLWGCVKRVKDEASQDQILNETRLQNLQHELVNGLREYQEFVT
ncbi:Protein TPLATE [Quillaja saponaria]|uniref:Protein TPLATE n=1 Tax=Quillaja saponaria TaxID=32244 RepID=A0AAD7LQZ9_QUISA|nr:Protein TPLATE [Quillaja saponaria]